MKNWPRVQISELCSLIVDCVNKTAPSVDHDTPYKMIRTTNIKNGRIDLTGGRSVSKETFEKWTKRAQVLKGDILLTREAPMGEVGRVNFDESVFLGQRVVQYRTNPKKLTSEYLLYSFLSPDLQYQFRRHDSSGSTVSHIRVPDCLKFEIPLPALDEQKKIAAVLSAIDAKIDCNNRINTELEAMAKTLYDYWFVQFDFPDTNGKPYKSAGGKMVYNAALKREIPEVWNSTTLASITPVSNDSLNPADFPDKEFKHFSIPVFDTTKTYGLEIGGTIGSNKFTVRATDLLVSKLNPWFSRVVYAMDEEDQICSTELVVWRCPSRNLKNFLFLIATSPQFIAHCTQSATGTSNSHKRVNPTVMMRFALAYHGDVAERFGAKISPILKRLILNQQENQQLAQLRDWLLPLLMNGQVKVA